MMRVSGVLFTFSFVILLLLTPVMLLLAPLPLLVSNSFIAFEYSKPEFPADPFGYTTEDRLRISADVIDYLRGDGSVETIQDIDTREVKHLMDVKALITTAFVVEIIVTLLVIIALALLASHPVYRPKSFLALLRGSQVTIVLLIILSVFFMTDWTKSFYRFHEIFFSGVSWMFEDDAMLLRLFPDQFWQHAAFMYFGLVATAAIVLCVIAAVLRRKR